MSKELQQISSFSHQADGLTWLEVFQLGTRPDSNGRTVKITAAEIDAANASYDVAKFRAPLIISHDTKGVADHALADSELAYGYPEQFKRVGKKVYAGFKKIVPQVIDWIRQGRIVDRSASFYLPEATTSPTPGKLAWRHIALLGRSNPACKGMAELNLNEVSQFSNELGLSETITAFSEESADSYINFSVGTETEEQEPVTTTTVITKADLEELRAEFAAKLEAFKPKTKAKGKSADEDSDEDSDEEDEAEDKDEQPKTKRRRTSKADMSQTKDKTQDTTEVDVSQYTEKITNLQQQLDAANAKIVELTPKPAPAPSAEELAHRAKTQKLEALIALQESESLKGEVATCLKNNQERITPGLVNKTTVSYSERNYNADLAEFTEEPKTKEWGLADFMERVAKGRTDRADFEGFKNWLGMLPKQVDLSQKSVIPNGEAETPKPISPEQLATKAKQLVASRKAEGLALSYSEALDEIIASENVV